MGNSLQETLDSVSSYLKSSDYETVNNGSFNKVKSL